jgi:toxin CptA
MTQTFRLKPSASLAALLVCVHLVAIVAMIPLALPLWSRLMLISLLAIDLACSLRRDVLLLGPSSCTGLSLGREMAGMLDANGKLLPCRVLQDSLVTPFLTVVNVLPQGAHFSRSAIILPDSLDAESFRQLRVRLRWGL